MTSDEEARLIMLTLQASHKIDEYAAADIPVAGEITALVDYLDILLKLYLERKPV